MRNSAFGTLAFAGFLNFSGGVHQTKPVLRFEPVGAIKRNSFFDSILCRVLGVSEQIDFESYPTLMMPYPTVTANPAPTFVDLWRSISGSHLENR